LVPVIHGISRVRDNLEMFDEILQLALSPDHEDSWEMPPCGQMRGDMPRYGAPITRQQDAIVLFNPEKDRLVVDSEREVVEIANTHCVNRQTASLIVPLNRFPKWPRAGARQAET
jgi:hypothetical protein